MKKIVSLVIVSFFVFCIWACNSEKIDDKETEGEITSIVIPASYFSYAGTSIDEAVESYIKLGDEYCTSAENKDGNMYLKVTDKQRKNLIERNDEYIEELVAPLQAANDLYYYIGDEEYKELSFYFDEKLSVNAQVQAVFGASAGYGLNYILSTGDSNWSVHIAIYNCHTNKVVTEVDIPQGAASYGTEEWEESYRE